MQYLDSDSKYKSENYRDAIEKFDTSDFIS